jgi:hypothetical protein
MRLINAMEQRNMRLVSRLLERIRIVQNNAFFMYAVLDVSTRKLPSPNVIRDLLGKTYATPASDILTVSM